MDPPIKSTIQSSISSSKSVLKPAQKDSSNLQDPSMLGSQKQVKKIIDSNMLSEVNNISANIEQQANNDKLQQFAKAWKYESNFSILLIEKLSLIVKNYFKLMTEVDQKNDQIGLLIVYNKSLIEILNKFESQQRKLIQKLRTMEQFNVKAMRELCTLKKREFNAPEVKTQQSIFIKFSLKSLKYESPQKQPQQPDQDYKKKIENLFKNYLLEPNQHYLPIVQNKIKQKQKILKQSQSNTKLQLENIINDLKQLQDNIIVYNKGLENVSSQNMFDLYQLKWEIKMQMKNLDVEVVEDQNALNRERMFVNNVKTLHADLTNMKESQLQNYLKKQKEIRKTIKKQRVKQQEIFLRTCEEAETQNVQLKKDIKKLKQKILQLEEELSKIKAQNEFRTMKKGTKATGSDQLNTSEADSKIGSSKRIKLEDFKKLKEQNEKLNKILQDKKAQLEERERQRIMMIKRARANNVEVEDNIKEVQLIQLLLLYFNRQLEAFHNQLEVEKEPQRKISGSLSVPTVNGDKQQQLISPKLDEKGLFGFNSLTNAQFLKGSLKRPPLDQRSLESTQRLNKVAKNKDINEQIDNLNKRIEQLTIRQGQKDLMIQRLQSQKRLDKESLKTLQQTIKILRRQLQDRQHEISQKKSKLHQTQQQSQQKQSQIQKQSNIKNEKIKQLLKQLQTLRIQYKNTINKANQLKYQNQCAQKLAIKITKSVESLIHQDITSDKFLLLTDQMFQNFNVYVEEYNRETKRNIEFRGEFQVEGMRAEKNYQEEFNFGGFKVNKEVVLVQSQNGSKKALIKKKSMEIEQKQATESRKPQTKKQKSQSILKQQSHKQTSRELISKEQHSNSNSKISQTSRIKKQHSMPQLMYESKNEGKRGNEEISQSESIIMNQDKSKKQYKKNQKHDIDESRSRHDTKNNQEAVHKRDKQQNKSVTEPNTPANFTKKQHKRQGVSAPNISVQSPDPIRSNSKESSAKEQFEKEYEMMKNKHRNLRKAHIKSTSQCVSPYQSRVSLQTENMNDPVQQFRHASPTYKITPQKTVVPTPINQKITQHDTKVPQQTLQKTQQKQKTDPISQHPQTKKIPSQQPSKPRNKPKQHQPKPTQTDHFKKDQISQIPVTIQTLEREQDILYEKLTGSQYNTKHNRNENKNEYLSNNNSKMEGSYQYQYKDKDKDKVNNKSGYKKQVNDSKGKQGSYQVQFNLSEDVDEEELGDFLRDVAFIAKPDDHRFSHYNTSKLEKSALDAGVELMIIERMQQKFRRLYNDEDALDFYQLFQRYKQALKCLQRAEQLNRYHELQYQKFLNLIKQKKQADPSFSVLGKLHNLQRKVLEQQQQLQEQKQEFETVFIEQIMLSKKAVEQHLEMLRRQYKKTGNH